MLRRPAHATRRRVAAHACPDCHRLWALRGVRTDSGAWLISCSWCAWTDLRPTGAQRRADPAPEPDPASPTDGRWSHGVFLYERDDQLLSVLEDYLADGWSTGATGLVIATPEHRRALTERLARRGGQGAPGEGRLVQLDAAATLAQFMAHGSPDPDAFDRTVGSLVRDHAADAGGLRGFGEMVDVLWAEGNAVGAIELERLWSRLQDEVHFTLLCAYATAHVDPRDRDVIVAAHEHVVDAVVD